MHLEDVAVKADLRAVVELGVAGVAAHVKAARVVTGDELETHRVTRARSSGPGAAAELVDEKIGRLRGGSVARRDDRGVAHDHEALAVGGFVREANERFERRLDEAVTRVIAMQ